MEKPLHGRLSELPTLLPVVGVCDGGSLAGNDSSIVSSIGSAFSLGLRSPFAGAFGAATGVGRGGTGSAPLV
jgi:hypothetical protein